MKLTGTIFLTLLAALLYGQEAGKKTMPLPGKTNTEYISWHSLKINNRLPLLSSKEAVYKLLGKPDRVIRPDMDTICVSFFEKDLQYAYFGESCFELSGDTMVVSSIHFEKGSRIKLHTGTIVFDSSLTLAKMARLYPQAVKNQSELLLGKEGMVTCVKLATSKESGDDAWLLFFKAGKLIQMDYWMPC